MGRGKALTPEDIAVVSALYESVKAEMPPGAVIGADRLMDKTPPRINRL